MSPSFPLHRVAVAVALAGCTYASQAVAAETADLSLEDLLKTEITTVSRKPESLQTTAAAAFVITREDIERSGAQHIPDALRLAPGISVARIANNRWAVTARGFNGRFANKLLVLIDGRSIYSPLFSGVLWEVEDTLLEDVERIEVIRGPGASLWGANAVNGVINIITRKARDTQGELAVAVAGTQDNAFGALRHGGDTADGHYRVWIKGARHGKSVDAARGRRQRRLSLRSRRLSARLVPGGGPSPEPERRGVRRPHGRPLGSGGRDFAHRSEPAGCHPGRARRAPHGSARVGPRGWQRVGTAGLHRTWPARGVAGPAPEAHDAGHRLPAPHPPGRSTRSRLGRGLSALEGRHRHARHLLHPADKPRLFARQCLRSGRDRAAGCATCASSSGRASRRTPTPAGNRNPTPVWCGPRRRHSRSGPPCLAPPAHHRGQRTTRRSTSGSFQPHRQQYRCRCCCATWPRPGCARCRNREHPRVRLPPPARAEAFTRPCRIPKRVPRAAVRPLRQPEVW